MPEVVQRRTVTQNFNDGSVGAWVSDEPHFSGGYAQYASGGRTGLCSTYPGQTETSGRFAPGYHFRDGQDFERRVSAELWFRIDQGVNPPANWADFWSRGTSQYGELLETDEIWIEYETPLTTGERPVLTGAPPIVRVWQRGGNLLGTVTVQWGTWFRVRLDYLDNTIQVGGSTWSFNPDDNTFPSGEYLLEVSGWAGRYDIDSPQVSGEYSRVRVDDLSLTFDEWVEVPPPPPVITQPADGSVSTERRPTFTGTRPAGEITWLDVYNAADGSRLARDYDVADADRTWSIPSDVYPLAPGTYTVFARQYDGMYSEPSNYVTFRIVVTGHHPTRLYPRDDQYGLGSAPRIHPPPKRGRVVGGYQ